MNSAADRGIPIRTVDKNGHPVYMLPPDPWWPRRVPVANDGDCVPFHLMLLYHWQWSVRSEANV